MWHCGKANVRSQNGLQYWCQGIKIVWLGSHQSWVFSWENRNLKLLTSLRSPSQLPKCFYRHLFCHEFPQAVPDPKPPFPCHLPLEKPSNLLQLSLSPTSETAWEFAPSKLLSFQSGFAWWFLATHAYNLVNHKVHTWETTQLTVTPAPGDPASSSGHHWELHSHVPIFPYICTGPHKNNNETKVKCNI